MTTKPRQCPACASAKAGPSGEFRSDCLSCAARAVARSPQFHASRQAGRLLPEYRELLARIGVTHDMVKAAHAEDAEAHDHASATADHTHHDEPQPADST